MSDIIIDYTNITDLQRTELTNFFIDNNYKIAGFRFPIFRNFYATKYKNAIRINTIKKSIFYGNVNYYKDIKYINAKKTNIINYKYAFNNK